MKTNKSERQLILKKTLISNLNPDGLVIQKSRLNNIVGGMAEDGDTVTVSYIGPSCPSHS